MNMNMKKTIIVLLFISMIVAVSGCNTGKTKELPETSQNVVSQGSVETAVSENEPEMMDSADEDESQESDEQSSDTESEIASAVVSVSEESLEQSSNAGLSARELKESLNAMFSDQNLGVIYRALTELYGKDYVKTNIEYYDCKNGKTIFEKDNWTIREWSFSDNKLRLGCEKTTFGIGSLKNALDSITNSDAYQAVSKISDIVGTAKNLGILKDD